MHHTRRSQWLAPAPVRSPSSSRRSASPWPLPWAWRRTNPAPWIPVALVERVVDGDTVVVRLEGQSVKVRLIGVDTPESVDPRKPVERFGHESADFLRRLVEGRRVRLAYEPAGTRVDKYGRLLAYL